MKRPQGNEVSSMALMALPFAVRETRRPAGKKRDPGLPPQSAGLRWSSILAWLLGAFALCGLTMDCPPCWITVCLAETQQEGEVEEGGRPSSTDSAAPSVQRGDPLVEISRWMSDVEQRLRRGETGPQTRRLQQDVVQRLDALIRQAEDAASSSAASATSSSQGQPQTRSESGEQAAAQEKEGNASSRTDSDSDSSRAAGDQNRPTASDLQSALQRVWGELPQRERDLLMQHGTDTFVPKYRAMIEAYFRRLSEGRSQHERGGAAALPSSPSAGLQD